MLEGATPAESVSLWLEVEGGCNWECVFCYNPWRFGDFARPERLDVQATLADVRSIAEYVRVEQCTISGGEPLLLAPERLAQLVAGLQASNIATVLTTNGSRLGRDTLDQLVAAGLDAVQISIHGSTEQTHDSLTQRLGSFREAIAGAAIAAQGGIDLWITVVLGESNLSEAAGVVRLAHVLGAGVIVNEVTPTVSRDAAMEKLRITDRARLDAALADAIETAQNLEVELEPGSPFEDCRDPSVKAWRGEAESACPVQDDARRFTLDTQGRLRTCNHSPFTIGSLRENSPAELIAGARAWASEARAASDTACLFSTRRVESVQLGPSRLGAGRG